MHELSNASTRDARSARLPRRGGAHRHRTGPLNIRLGATILSGIVALSVFAPTPALAADDVVCQFSDPRFGEISGMTPSIRHPNVLWLHNDSGGGPRIFAVDATTCKTLATLTIKGARARDFEAIASGRDAAGRAVLWLGDIGDNLDSWDSVEILRIKEPRRLRSREVSAETVAFTYADRPHNAEALLASPKRGRLWVVTKQLARGSLYRLPAPLRSGVVNVARKIQVEGGLITDGAISPLGDRYVLRDYVDAVIYDGLPPGREIARIHLPYQTQGEAIAWSADGQSLLVASERDDRLIRVPVPLVLRQARQGQAAR